MKGYLIDKDIELKDLPSKLVTCDAPVIEEGSTEVLVDVYSAALNFFDILQVQGKYQVKKPFPYVPGAEIAGVISKDSPIPEGCDFIPGKTRVFGAANGSYAEQVTAEYYQLQVIPDGISFEEASGLFVTWPTSYAALKLRANVKEGEWVLVHAGAGGVGLCAIQIAKAMGAKVVATAGTEEKLKVCKNVGGADVVVNYRDKDWQKQVKDQCDGGVDVVYDPVGMINPSLKVINWNGRIVVVGFVGGTIEKIPANMVLLKNCSITGVFWGAYIANEPERIPETWDALMSMLKKREVKPTVYEHVYDGLESLAEALQDLQARKTWGKVAIRVRADPEHPPKGKARM